MIDVANHPVDKTPKVVTLPFEQHLIAVQVSKENVQDSRVRPYSPLCHPVLVKPGHPTVSELIMHGLVVIKTWTIMYYATVLVDHLTTGRTMINEAD